MQPTIHPSIKLLLASGLLSLTACGTSLNRAPVEERPISGAAKTTTPASAPVPAAAPVTAAESKPLPGAENAGKPGYYTVRPGDTLIRIALDNGQNWRDLSKWNGLDKPNLIEVGQVLRVLPPGVDAASVAARPITSAKVESRPLDAKPGAAAGGASTTAPGAATASASAASAGASAAVAAPAAARDADEDPSWAWPTGTAVGAGFDEQRNKGLAFFGKSGDAVLAAADGRVVYAGSGLRGYGNLVIIKHNATYLTAYAHNQTLLVKEDQAVRKGQKIAEMGSSDAEQVKLHFEVRKLGKPIDPAKVLPSR
ncbi:peptidoglycan DD-metalloendopeptidase family protein [Paucibacter sp. DJ2R-2]|uniref:peptidoglycan DD-metalloendopeptidase family protein n=1 Tax=Paucibacter sp. DJ2R-2 TaxID=2893558 RepID=UPI0021E3FBA3|nr:peptidoglycan DD-metalloendopeptidase family protein [Paucibacter sp. DJ2R-2]MCV2420788.1 peptidoglycan DD-metalloendopeptidase family protein [Paucibacter sp. DJ4R-1]MCV2439987.1 peptidoglycan DD-metalloendopeptidase family protein [Paucibacter sp. DJ2R-2]